MVGIAFKSGRENLFNLQCLMECHKWKLHDLSTAPLGSLMSISFLCPHIDPSKRNWPSVCQHTRWPNSWLVKPVLGFRLQTQRHSHHQLDSEMWRACAHMVLVSSFILEATYSLFTCTSGYDTLFFKGRWAWDFLFSLFALLAKSGKIICICI